LILRKTSRGKFAVNHRVRTTDIGIRFFNVCAKSGIVEFFSDGKSHRAAVNAQQTADKVKIKEMVKRQVDRRISLSRSRGLFSRFMVAQVSFICRHSWIFSRVMASNDQALLFSNAAIWLRLP
jgi:hypothetical protein